MKQFLPALLLGLILMSVNNLGISGIEFASFEDPEKEQLYKQLINELRCLVCQNQTIAGSNASLAKDLRKITYTMVLDNKSYDDVVDFMTERYGDFVMYRPPFKLRTAILWIAPAVFLLIGLWLMLRYVRSRSTSTHKELSAEDHQRATALLDENKDDNN